MIRHVRYEITKTIDFLTVGNGWVHGLDHQLTLFIDQSILEAGLIHFRNLIEFLGGKHKSDRVVARDYLDEWGWTISANLRRVSEVHSRLAHLGTIRHTADGFDWRPWIEENSPVVLRSVHDFLARLRDASPRRYEMFLKPSADQQRVDLLPILDRLSPPR